MSYPQKVILTKFLPRCLLPQKMAILVICLRCSSRGALEISVIYFINCFITSANCEAANLLLLMTLSLSRIKSCGVDRR